MSMRIWWSAAVLLLVLVTCQTRLSAPWRLEVTNDEMHHLESWRNRYKSDDIYPLFLQKLEASGRLSPARLELVRKLYHSSPLAQRAMIILVDPQPPLFPVLAETTQKISDSSLIGLRLWSVAFSLAAIWIAWLLGQEIAGRLCGMWLAVLVCIGAVTQHYAGIGRPYALTQLVILLATWAFVRRQKGQIGLGQFLVWCLLAQAVQWMAWAVIGPMVMVELLRQWRSDGGLRTLVRKSWWYVVLSMLLLLEMLVQLRNPIISKQGGLMSLDFVWLCFAVAAPTGHIGSFGDGALHVGAAIFAILGIVGAIATLSRWTTTDRPQRLIAVGLVASAAAGIIASVVVGVSVRFEVSYIATWLVLAAVGLCALLPAEKIGVPVSMVVLAIFGSLAIWHPVDPYQRIDDYDVRWSQVAARLKQELQPGQRWVGFAPSIACNLYQYGPLPEPIMPFQWPQLQHMITSGEVDSALVLLESDGNYPGMEALIRSHVSVIQDYPMSGGPSRYVLGRVKRPATDVALDVAQHVSQP